MKKITIVFFSIFLGILVGFILFVSLSKDFQEPKYGVGQEEYGINPNSPIWNASIDDLAQYLLDQGVISSLDYSEVSDGISTIARKYNGIEIYWWDVKNLKEGTPEYKTFTEMSKSGIIDLWSSGNMMGVVQQGPFGINPTSYTGKIDELMEVYHKFGVE